MNSQSTPSCNEKIAGVRGTRVASVPSNLEPCREEGYRQDPGSQSTTIWARGESSSMNAGLVSVTPALHLNNSVIPLPHRSSHPANSRRRALTDRPDPTNGEFFSFPTTGSAGGGVHGTNGSSSAREASMSRGLVYGNLKLSLSLSTFRLPSRARTSGHVEESD